MNKFGSTKMTKTELVSFVEESIRWIEKQTDWVQEGVDERLRMITR